MVLAFVSDGCEEDAAQLSATSAQSASCCSLLVCMQYRVCPVKLVGVLYNRVLFQKSPSHTKGPQRLRRLPPYALADVALAVADLHTHCGKELAKLPHILPIIRQATAEAICATSAFFQCHPQLLCPNLSLAPAWWCMLYAVVAFGVVVALRGVGPEGELGGCGMQQGLI